MMPSFKNTASIFPEISFIQYFPLLSGRERTLGMRLIQYRKKYNIVESHIKAPQVRNPPRYIYIIIFFHILLREYDISLSNLWFEPCVKNIFPLH